MSGKRGFYSDIIIYDEKRRYYYLWPQKNKPFLDDEIRDMGIGLLDQVRRAVQSIYGDVAAPDNQYSGFYSTADSFKVKQATDSSKNFVVTGGYSLDHPAVLYAKGFYIFMVGDVEYKHQMYPSDTIDLNTETDKTKTLTPIPMLTTPPADRIDIVYVNLHFEEVSAVSGTDSDVYRDSGLKNPVVGTETAHRLRAVFDIRVREGWTDPVNKDIFMHSEFLGGISSNSSDPTENEYKIPIAAIYREAFDDTITTANIVDLLTLYSKRVLSVEEISYRTKHGGYVAADVAEKGLSGFTPQFPGAIVDEGAFATGLNRGLGTEALNTNSVTPRVLDNDGKFFMQGLMVGHATGVITYETGPEQLNTGEAVFDEVSTRSIYVGYGVTGITGMREYKDGLNVVVQGLTGRVAASFMDIGGETGSGVMRAGAVHSGKMENFFYVDYKGRLGLNTLTPGWDSLPVEWATERYNDGLGGITGVNVVEDVAGSVRVRDHLFVDKDGYMHRDLFGRTWKIPEAMSNQTPAFFGFTGIPDGSFTGIGDSIAAIVFKRGVAVVGETGVVGYGYTGMGVAGQYECFDSEGRRMFTIGDLGWDFDRVVKSLYGVSLRKTFLSDTSFLHMREDSETLPTPIIYDPPGFDTGDEVHYDVVLEGGDHVTGVVTVVTPGYAGLEEVRDDILANGNFPGGSYTRTFTYKFYVLDSDPDFDGTDDRGKYRLMDGSPARPQGTAEGVQIIDDPFGEGASLVDSHGQYMNGRLIFKDIDTTIDPANPILLENVSMRVVRGSTTLAISFTQGGFYGASEFGGALTNIKFAKLDLGEAADGWLFNGDVYFNSTGLMNRVTFSPNVVFRDDVFVYGSLFADQMMFNFADVSSLHARNNVIAENLGYFVKGVAAGDGAFAGFDGKLGTYVNTKIYAKGSILAEGLDVESVNSEVNELGSVVFRNSQPANINKLYARIGGTVGSETDPFGLHLIDDRGPSVADENKFKDFWIDASNGRGGYVEDMALRIRGDLYAGSYFQAQYLGVGPITVPNTDYRLMVEGPALVNDVLTVKALRFVGAEAVEGISDIVTPQNISIIGKGVVSGSDSGEAYQNNDIILREKKFTSNSRIYINNDGKLGENPITLPPTGETGAYYYTNSIKSEYYARWAKDDVSFTEKEFRTLAGSGNTIVVPDITNATYKRYSMERITLATLGTLSVTWGGYKYDPTAAINVNPITEYKLTDSYLRGRDGSITINWMPGSSTFDSDNFTCHVEGTIINTNAATPSIYYVNTNLGLYIAKTAWWYGGIFDEAGDGGNTDYRSFVIFYPWEETLNLFNKSSFSTQYGGGDSPAWRLGLYPRLWEQTRSTSGSNQDKIYTGKWNLDIIIFPENVGTCSNLVGKLYISYCQS